MEKSIVIENKKVIVTDDGQIYCDGLPMKIKTYSTGYKYISISNSHYLIHRLVAHLFIKPLIRGDRTIQVHHINEDKSDNRVENLMIMSMKDHQHLHKQKYPITKKCIVCGKEYIPNKTKRKRSVTCSPDCKKRLDKIHASKRKRPISQYSLDGVMLREWDSARDIQNELNIFESNINNCCKGRIKSYKGYIWKYKG